MAIVHLTSLSVVAGAALILGFLYKFVIYPTFLSPLSKIPTGHWSAHFLPFWILHLRRTDQENVTILWLHEEKGPILRLGPNELSVNDYAEGLKKIYLGGWIKNDFYAHRFTNYETTPMFAMVHGKEHSERKRMLSHVYSKTQVLSSATTRATTEAILYERLLPIFQNSSDTDSPVEVLELNYAYAMDAFMAFQFGLSLASNFIQDVQKRKWYLNDFFSRRPYLFYITETPKLLSRLAKVGVHIVPQWVDAATDALESWNLDICDRAEQLLAQGREIPAIDYPVIYAQERAAMRKSYPGTTRLNTPRPDQFYPFRYEIASDMYDHNAAAHETSGDTLTYVYYEMSRNPVLQKRLRDELLTLDPPVAFPLADPGDITLPDFKAVEGLPLLDAILMETLRLWVAVPGGQPRLSPYPSCSIAGYDNIPPNTKVQCYAYALHRNPKVYEEPEEWRPERWLDASAEKLTEMRRWFWAFGSGGRMCIGNNIAMHCESVMVP
ncbi:cytochrome P450 [Exophiala viscosa]|uniref:cytochrome P450 n=1 Tax=Exophiala viscosa TaxID=2486360 RepID=UPI0021A0BD39|nr:cytochrome P450 [Exophiala viscosa]